MSAFRSDEACGSRRAEIRRVNRYFGTRVRKGPQCPIRPGSDSGLPIGAAPTSLHSVDFRADQLDRRVVAPLRSCVAEMPAAPVQGKDFAVLIPGRHRNSMTRVCSTRERAGLAKGCQGRSFHPPDFSR